MWRGSLYAAGETERRSASRGKTVSYCAADIIIAVPEAGNGKYHLARSFRGSEMEGAVQELGVKLGTIFVIGFIGAPIDHAYAIGRLGKFKGHFRSGSESRNGEILLGIRGGWAVSAAILLPLPQRSVTVQL